LLEDGVFTSGLLVAIVDKNDLHRSDVRWLSTKDPSPDGAKSSSLE
jgi:hypothetical protein